MSIEILTSGFNTTLQDRGRFGSQDQGVPTSGFMDVGAAHMANILVTNERNTCLLEMSLVGLKFKALHAITIAITGANMSPMLADKPISMYKAIEIPEGGIVSFKGASCGVYCYVAVFGGINVPKVLNSQSTYEPAAIGGMLGRALQKGDLLPVSNQTLKQIHSKVRVPPMLTKVNLECSKGPEWDLVSDKSKAVFFETTFMISNQSNRIGIRLEGTPIQLSEKDEIISSGIVRGTVQITKSGQPIVMMADAPTTGGYIRLVNLTLKACDLLAQVPIGGEAKFLLLS